MYLNAECQTPNEWTVQNDAASWTATPCKATSLWKRSGHVRQIDQHLLQLRRTQRLYACVCDHTPTPHTLNPPQAHTHTRQHDATLPRNQHISAHGPHTARCLFATTATACRTAVIRQRPQRAFEACERQTVAFEACERQTVCTRSSERCEGTLRRFRMRWIVSLWHSGLYGSVMVVRTVSIKNPNVGFPGASHRHRRDTDAGNANTTDHEQVVVAGSSAVRGQHTQWMAHSDSERSDSGRQATGHCNMPSASSLSLVPAIPRANLWNVGGWSL